MKKISVLFFILISYLFSPAFVSADYPQTLADYKTGLEKYHSQYQLFVKAKSTYLKYKTLNSQTEALDKTKQFLEVRDEVLILYFTLLKEKLNIAPGILDFEKSLEIYQIDTYIQQFAKHKESIPAVATLDDCITNSEEIGKEKEDLEIFADKIHGVILVGKVNAEAEKFSQTVIQINNLLGRIKAENQKVDKLERWLLETNYKYELSQKKLQEAKSAFENLNITYYDQNQKNFLQAKQLVIEGNQYLKEAVYNAKEALNEIKTGSY